MQLKQLKLKRIYEAPSAQDGVRILVDRLWPRGMSKQKAKLDYWLKEIAPSTELRKWFHQNSDKHWVEFKKRYLGELRNNTVVVNELLNILKEASQATLLFASQDKTQNHALVLRDFLVSL